MPIFKISTHYETVFIKNTFSTLICITITLLHVCSIIVFVVHVWLLCMNNNEIFLFYTNENLSWKCL